mgnify:FL=1
MKLNLLTRTHNRETYFKACRASVESQTYKDINWIVGSDTDCPYYPQAIKLFKDYRQPLLIPQGHYHAPYNRYLEVMAEYCQEGIVSYLDDDDMYVNEKSAQRIVNAFQDENDLLIWKVQILPNWIVPSHSFGKYIAAGDISGIGYAFHTKHLPVEWGVLSYGDFRVAKQLIEKGLKPRWIDMVLTRTIDKPHNGK